MKALIEPISIIALMAIGAFLIILSDPPLTERECPPIHVPDNIGQWEKPDYSLPKGKSWSLQPL